MAWGYNQSGQLGDGTKGESSKVPVAVSKLSGVTALATAGNGLHTLALLSKGTVMAWGENSAGQLGDGKMESSDVPVAVSGLAGVKAISASGSHSLALNSSGSVFAWGANNDGQLGDGTSTGPEPCGFGSCSTKPIAVNTHARAWHRGR